MQNFRRRSFLHVLAACNVHERLQQWDERHNACREKTFQIYQLRSPFSWRQSMEFFFCIFLHETVSKRYTGFNVRWFCEWHIFVVQSLYGYWILNRWREYTQPSWSNRCATNLCAQGQHQELWSPSVFGSIGGLKFSDYVTFFRGKFSWDSSLCDSIRYAKELYCVTKIPLESTQTQDVAQGNRVRAWSQIEFNQTVYFFHAVLFLSPPLLQGEVPYGKSVMIKRRNRGVSEINGAIVRHIKSDDHVDSGKVVTRSMFSHTIISSSNTNFWKIGSHDTFERAIQSHCGKVNLSRSRWNRSCINERSVVTTWELPTIATQLHEADFHPAVSVTNELGRLFFLHQPVQIASWTIEKQHDPRLPSVRQSEPCQHSSRHGRNTKYVSEMKIVQNPNLLGTMCAESMIEDRTWQPF